MMNPVFRGSNRARGAFLRPLLQSVLAGVLLLLATFAGTGRAAAQSTYFIDAPGTFSSLGEWWVQGFSVPARTGFVLRFTADYAADAAIIKPGQLNAFKNNRTFNGYALFDNRFGTKYITLDPGEYYVVVRNQTSGSNRYRLELDLRLKLPKDDNYKYQFFDVGATGSEYLAANGGKLWQRFTVNSGYRYFLDGCNTGLDIYVIPENQLSAFKNDSGFSYYTDYSGTDNALPGHYELNLPPGTYYLVARNGNSIKKPLTYTLERWKKVPRPSGYEIDLSGSSSWRTSGSKVDIRVGKVSNQREGGVSGTLRLRLWATSSPYRGATIRGYVLGTRKLGQLQGGYYYSDIYGYVGLTRPPSGTYYTTITLEEYTGSGYVIRDYVTFSGTSRF